MKIGLRSDLSWPKVGLEPKFHEPGTFGGFGNREHTDRHTRFMFYKYRYDYETPLHLVTFRRSLGFFLFAFGKNEKCLFRFCSVACAAKYIGRGSR